MLVLQRRDGQALVLTGADGEVLATVKVVRCVSGAVKLGVDAPRQIHVRRSELKPRQNKEERLVTDDRFPGRSICGTCYGHSYAAGDNCEACGGTGFNGAMILK